MKKLNKIINSNDILVFISTVAQVKSFKMLNENLMICQNVFKVLIHKKIKYLLYVSSDAVYSDSKVQLMKNRRQTRQSSRFYAFNEENILKLLDIKMCIVRPTLVYGSIDPRGYG